MQLIEAFFFWVFIIKQCVEYCPKSFNTAKYGCVIKGIKYLINSSVILTLTFLILIISAVISLSTISFFVSWVDFTHQYIYRNPAYCSNVQCKTLDPYGALCEFFHVFIRYWYFALFESFNI